MSDFKFASVTPPGTANAPSGFSSYIIKLQGMVFGDDRDNGGPDRLFGNNVPRRDIPGTVF